MTRVLLLAGTAEALELSRRLAAIDGIELVTSLLGATRRPAGYAGKVRRGGFGGAPGLAAYLAAEGVGAIIDATHPFAAQINANVAQAAAWMGTPRVRLLRPSWEIEPGWQRVPSLAAALDALPTGARAFCTTGSFRTEPLGRRPDCEILLRAIEKPASVPERVRLIRARPPFAVEDEIALMRAERVTHLITRNSGGRARARLDAARHLAIPVLMIDRPEPPPGPTVADVEAAVAWVRARIPPDGGLRRNARA